MTAPLYTGSRMRPIANASGLDSRVRGFMHDVARNGIAVRVIERLEWNDDRARVPVHCDCPWLDEYLAHLCVEATSHPRCPRSQFCKRFAKACTNSIPIAGIATVDDHRYAVHLRSILNLRDLPIAKPSQRLYEELLHCVPNARWQSAQLRKALPPLLPGEQCHTQAPECADEGPAVP